MNDMVSIPRGEYERLLEAAEDLADLTAFDRAVEARPTDVKLQIALPA